MRVACLTMQRDEELCLEPWFRYHAHLFGAENLYALDHNSQSVKVLALLEDLGALGLNVTHMAPDSPYELKGFWVAEELKRIDKLGTYDILIPLDCDEFLVHRAPGDVPSLSRTDIYDCLAGLIGEPRTLQTGCGFLNHPRKMGFFCPVAWHKVFFTSGCCVMLDHGSHRGKSARSDELLVTELGLLHFHNKPFEHGRAQARQKLAPWVDPDDLDALIRFNGPGLHLKRFFMQSADDYYRDIEAMPGMSECTGYVELFRELGIDPGFCVEAGQSGGSSY